MQFEFCDKKEANRKTKYGEMYALISQMIKEGRECVRIECKDEKEARTVYQTIYANTIRRHKLPVARVVKKNVVYVINENVGSVNE